MPPTPPDNPPKQAWKGRQVVFWYLLSLQFSLQKFYWLASAGLCAHCAIKCSRNAHNFITNLLRYTKKPSGEKSLRNFSFCNVSLPDRTGRFLSVIDINTKDMSKVPWLLYNKYDKKKKCFDTVLSNSMVKKNLYFHSDVFIKYLKNSRSDDLSLTTSEFAPNNYHLQ